MKVLGIVAGPRKTGHTARLVEEVLRGAEEVGHEAKIFYLGDKTIKPLTWDGEEYGYPKDDFTEIMPHIESMGALVLGSPIYFDQVSSRAKLFIDRLYFYGKHRGPEYNDRFPKDVKFINALTHGWDDENSYKDIAEWLNARMRNYWDMLIVGGLKAHGSGNNPVKDNEELLKEARELGKSL